MEVKWQVEGSRKRGVLQSRLGMAVPSYSQVLDAIRINVLWGVGHGVGSPSAPVHMHQMPRAVGVALLTHIGEHGRELMLIWIAVVPPVFIKCSHSAAIT